MFKVLLEIFTESSQVSQKLDPFYHRTVWKIISDITNPKVKEHIILKENNFVITEEKEVANTLNNFFVKKLKNSRTTLTLQK